MGMAISINAVSSLSGATASGIGLELFCCAGDQIQFSTTETVMWCFRNIGPQSNLQYVGPAWNYGTYPKGPPNPPFQIFPYPSTFTSPDGASVPSNQLQDLGLYRTLPALASYSSYPMFEAPSGTFVQEGTTMVNQPILGTLTSGGLYTAPSSFPSILDFSECTGNVVYAVDQFGYWGSVWVRFIPTGDPNRF